jgi:hypothetical protein
VRLTRGAKSRQIGPIVAIEVEPGEVDKGAKSRQIGPIIVIEVDRGEVDKRG